MKIGEPLTIGKGRCLGTSCSELYFEKQDIKSAIKMLKKELHYIKDNGERCEYGRICGKINMVFMG
jgi:hypothetical protein